MRVSDDSAGKSRPARKFKFEFRDCVCKVRLMHETVFDKALLSFFYLEVKRRSATLDVSTLEMNCRSGPEKLGP